MTKKQVKGKLDKTTDHEMEIILEDKVEMRSMPNQEKPAKDVKVTPYREITFSDGHEFYIKTSCNLTSDNRVQVVQYRENTDPDGVKFLYSDPEYFESKTEFLEWLVELLLKNFDKIPYITISPIKEADLKRQERESTDTMYL